MSWEWRETKKHPVLAADGSVIAEGQNAALGVVDPTWFTRPKTGGKPKKSTVSWRRQAKWRSRLRQKEMARAERIALRHRVTVVV